jgi:MFS family permease
VSPGTSAAPAPAARRPPAPTDPDARHNFRHAVANGGLFQTGEAFIDAGTVIPVFLSRLTSSNALIGCATAMLDIGWLVPQVFVAPWAARFERQLPIYIGAALVRAIALGTLAVMTWVLRDQPGVLLPVFFACFALFALGAGFGGVAFMEVIGRTIPTSRLGSLFAQRMFWGGLFGAAAGLVVREVLELGDSQPRFAILFGLATLFVSIGYWQFASIKEPAIPPRPSADTPLSLLREGFQHLRRDSPFRRLLFARMGYSLWSTVGPFLVLFAVHDLGGGLQAAGTFLLARVSGAVVSNVVWQRWSRRRGNRAVMRAATTLNGGVAFAAFAIALVSPWWLGWIGAGAAVIALELAMILGGAAQSGMLIGYGSLVIELAPPGRRQAFVGLMNTFVGPTMLLPMIGGTIVDWINAPVMFAACAAAALITVRAAGKLPVPETADELARESRGLVTGDEP